MRRLSAICLISILLVALSGPLYAQSEDHAVFQISTFHALKQGMLETETTFGELGKHGNFGLGTLNSLDGEMVALNGEFFQIKADGSVHSVPDDAKTPFAVVTFFKPDKKVAFPGVYNLKRLQAALDRIQPNTDSILALKVNATFSQIKVRSPSRQQKPYPTLEEALKHQVEFEFKNVRGTLVGFRFPRYWDGVNVPGDHLHFIAADKKSGGHVMDCTAKDANVEIAVISNFSLKFPTSGKGFR